MVFVYFPNRPMAQARLDEVIRRLDEMLAESQSFEDIQDFIEAQNLSRDERNTLWLWAWSEQPRAIKRRVIPLPQDTPDL